ncbi:hypothetical protein H9P43_001976 [Blastocladiella emersonii ATCC 22665]|nr:hypothetical protein H9P43_001976 [Blastocladiella emersonii ATCC 22665]
MINQALGITVASLIAVIGATIYFPYLAGLAVLGTRPIHFAMVVASAALRSLDVAEQLAVDYLHARIDWFHPTVADVVRQLRAAHAHAAAHPVRYRDVYLSRPVSAILDELDVPNVLTNDEWPIIAFVVLLGWATLASVAAAYWFVTRRRSVLARVGLRVIKTVGRTIAKTVKLVAFTLMEWMLFPAYTGVLLNAFSFPLFPYSLDQRLAFAARQPFAAYFLHWFIGTLSMFHLANLVGAAREVLRPGVMWFIRDPSDPEFSPYREIAEKSPLIILRKFAISLVLYAIVVGGIVGTATVGLVALGVTPLRTPNVALTDVPLDLVILGEEEGGALF